MTINQLLAIAGLTADDEIPVWDNPGSTPDAKITAANLASSIKTLAGLIATSDLDTEVTEDSANAVQSGAVYEAIQQSTAVESTTITLDSSIVGSINRNFIRRSGHVVTINLQFDFKTVPTVGTSYAIGEIPVGYRPNYSCEFMGNGVGSSWKNTDLSTFSFANNGVITVIPRGIATNNWYVLNAVYLVP